MKKEKYSAIDTLERYSTYIEDLYDAGNSLKRQEFIRQTAWKDFVPVIDGDSARFLQLILQMKKPMKILEIGTSIGFSAASMALTAREYGGIITTIEFDKTAYDQAKINFQKAGVSDNIKMTFGDACEIISKISNESFDLVFQDVDNCLYSDLLKDCIRILKHGGIFIADDTLFPVMDLDDKYISSKEPIDRFNHLVVNSSDLKSTLLPIGDGMTFAVKR